jgi:predicted AlkP superfamily phosphohydrolase/phosphomutase/tetratricopeptide (TPR) repeat protein
MNKKKILLIGWDGADWKYINPLLDAGLMPNLQKLVEGGSMGRLATLDPPLSPTLWTSIATGKRPYQHGIHGFTEPDPSGEGIRPIYSTNRKVKAIWNILTQHGLKTHVVGWWPSHPAEPINGVMISNLYQRASKPIHEPWHMLKGTVHPEDKADLLAKLRIHPEELTGNHIEPFVPNLDKVDQSKDKRLISIAKVLADCSTIHSAATYIMEHEEWDFIAVYYDAIDHFCHGFMKYHPPRRPHISIQDYELYKDVVAGGCRFHDMMLGRLMELSGEDTTIILLSDHGFHPDHNRPNAIPKEPAGPAVEHSPFGILVMNGEGIKKDDTIVGASLLDITPTLLHLYGLPVAEDMDGKVLINVFEQTPDIQTIKSWENIKGADGAHPKNVEIDAADAKAELQQLIELGYVEDPGENGEAAVKNTLDENNYNLARAYIDGGKWAEGIVILEKLHTENPTTMRFAVRLAMAYQSVGKLKDARKVVDYIRSIIDRESPQLDMLEATLLMAEERFKKALALLQKVEREAGEQPNLHLRLANAYLQLNRLEDAETAVLKELNINPEETSAHYALGLIYYRQMRYEDALNSFMDAVGLLFYNPSAHYYIGETLAAMQEYEKAIEAFDTCLKLLPGMNAARQRIIQIYETALQQPGKALKYKTDFQEKILGTINIVSGLPRSGTSMLMQMLEAGGLDIFTDGEREADENNPKGYYEHEAVKALKRNKAFLKEANGKTIKVIAQLLPQLPMVYRYRIVFVERDILEVIASQQRMLERDGKRVKTDTLPLNLMEQHKSTLQKVKIWAAEQPNVEIYYVQYKDILDAPFLQAMLINDFFEGTLAVEKMASVVDGQLYREKMV